MGGGGMVYPTVKMFELLPMFLVGNEKMIPHLPAIVAASIENGADLVHCTSAQFQLLVDRGVPPECLDPVVRTKEDYAVVKQAVKSMVHQPVHFGLPVTQLGAKMLLGWKCLEDAQEFFDELIAEAVDDKAIVTAVLRNSLSCRFAGNQLSATAIADEAFRLIAMKKCSRVIFEDGVGECQPRYVENLVKTVCSTGSVSRDQLGFLFRTTDGYLMGNSLNKALGFAVPNYCVVTGAAGKPRFADNILCSTEFLQILTATMESGNRDVDDGLELLEKSKRLSASVRKALGVEASDQTIS